MLVIILRVVMLCNAGMTLHGDPMPGLITRPTHQLTPKVAARDT